MNIAIFTGGDSSESVISIKSAGAVSQWLEKAGHNCYTVVVTGSDWMVQNGSEKIQLDKNLFGFKGPDGDVFFRFCLEYNSWHPW